MAFAILGDNEQKRRNPMVGAGPVPDAGGFGQPPIVEGEAVLNLSSIGVEVTLDMIYEEIEPDATRRREDLR
jgi:hypothetical protein